MLKRATARAAATLPALRTAMVPSCFSRSAPLAAGTVFSTTTPFAVSYDSSTLGLLGMLPVGLVAVGTVAAYISSVKMEARLGVALSQLETRLSNEQRALESRTQVAAAALDAGLRVGAAQLDASLRIDATQRVSELRADVAKLGGEARDTAQLVSALRTKVDELEGGGRLG